MTFIADLLEGGYWPLQHQDTRFHREFRIVRYACRTVQDNDLLVPVPDRGSTGPVMGGFLWSTLDRQEQPPIWSFAAPVVRHELEARDAGLGASRTWALEKEGDWKGIEPQLEQKELQTPHDQKYPLDWPGVALTSVNPDIQNDLVLPGFAGLVAPHRAGDPELGTPVWDVDVDGSLDPVRRARLQSLCRVYRYPPAACVPFGAGLEPGGLAWQLGTARSGLAGAGVVADLGAGGLSTIERGTSAPQVLATASVRAGGPLHVGGPGDQHNHGITPDGEVINSLHLSTSSLFLGHGGDAPLFFEGSKLKEESAPLVVPAHLRLDGSAFHRTPCGAYTGLWVFQAESFFSMIPDRFPPEDGEPLPPRTEPREPGDAVTSGADGWIALGGNPPQIAPLQQVRQLAGSPMELGLPALVFRPQSLNTSSTDLRNLPPSMFDQDAERQWSEAPAVLRMEAAGVEYGPDWSRTTEPGLGRYAAGGTGDGSLWLMPPELGLELAVGRSGLVDICDLDASRSGMCDLDDGGARRIRAATTGRSTVGEIGNEATAFVTALATSFQPQQLRRRVWRRIGPPTPERHHLRPVACYRATGLGHACQR